ncbi:hypothetical protein D9M68_617760 [compost metagenome]|uniref:hypothetical protein n=1 Tax=Achromobacter agilis TaxID=1353888 RepID=UPI0010100AC4
MPARNSGVCGVGALKNIFFKNQQEAGVLLARLLMRYADRPDVIVLALPRGGVPVGFQVAAALDAPLDVVMVRKIGVPGYSEYSIGATSGDQPLFQSRAIEVYGISRSISTGDLLVLDYVRSRPAAGIRSVIPMSGKLLGSSRSRRCNRTASFARRTDRRDIHGHLALSRQNSRWL